MLSNQKQYIVNLANLGSSQSELVGELALAFQNQLSAGIPIPMGYVVTATAFDDFLIANDLIDYIGPKINDADYTNVESIKKVAQEIRQVIHKASIPQIIADPIAKAYGGMSGFTDAGVNLLVSSLNPELEKSIVKSGSRRYQVMGLQNILTAVKDLWAEFFSFEALLFRNQVGYEGFLTEAIIVQKMIFPEISGKIYSFNPTDNDGSVYEVQAIWGGHDELQTIIPDSYYIEASNGQILERKINQQTEMLVRKSKYDGRGLFSRIKISQIMQRRAKLDDRNLQQLFVYASKVSDMLGKPVELQYCIEGGRTYIVEHRIWQEEPEQENSIFINKLDLEKHIDVDWGSKIEIIPGQPDDNPDDDFEYNRKAEKAFQKDLDAYVAEIQDETEPESLTDAVIAPEVAIKAETKAESKQEPVTIAEPVIEAKPETEERHEHFGIISSASPANNVAPRFGQPLPSTVVEKPEPASVVAVNTIETKTAEVITPLKEQVEKSDEASVILEPSEDKVVVDIKPVNELQTILKGQGNGSKTRFGLSHFVFEDFDLEDLTGDEVLVLKELNAHNLKFANAVRGVVSEQIPAEAVASAVKVPMIYGLKNAFEVIRDKEVITLEPETGKVYLGAGIKASQVTAESVAENVDINKPEAEKLTEKDIDVELPEKQDHNELQVASDVPHTNAHPLLEVADQAPELSEFTVNVYEDESIVPLNSTTEFWQTVDMLNPLVDVKNTTGIIVTADQLYQKFELDPREVFSDKYAFKTFLFKAANFIKDLILKSKGRNIIYQSASKDFLIAKNITEHVHDMVLVDLEVISWLRNRENLRGVWYSFADVPTAEYLYDIKKNISSEGIRRSATFKVFAHISEPYAAIAIKAFVENSNIDGIIIDLDAMIANMGVQFKEMDENIANFLKYVIEIVNTNNCQSFILNREIALDNSRIKLFLEKGLSDIITPVEKIMSTKLQVSDQELARLIKQKKRGRKSKKIDFGF